MIDTADVYSAWVPGHQGGESETVIGRWLKRDPAKRDKVVIATKVGFMAGLAPDVDRAAACDASLERLGIETIDLYYQHKDDQSVPLADSLGAFDALVKAGKIRAIGLSQFTAPRLRGGDGHGGANGSDSSLRASRPGTIWSSARSSKASCATPRSKHGLGILPFYSLANGFLTGKYRSQEDLDKSPRGDCARRLSRRQGHARSCSPRRDCRRNRRRARRRSRWPGRSRSPAIVAPLASATSVDQLQS